MPEIAAWRKTYAQMGLKPTKYRCAAESLLRRFRKEGALPSFHPLVDLCNALSLAYAMPIAVYDIDAIFSGLEVRYATSSEEHLNFSGHIEHPEPNEVVFVDQEDHAHSRRWCFRQSKHSVVSPVTTSALIVAEGQHTGAEGDITSLLDELSETCTHHWHKPALREQLSEHSPEALFLGGSE
jgi:DNA/RNA-binding domain of Phe-tRNA-synthetase-like protein